MSTADHGVTCHVCEDAPATTPALDWSDEANDLIPVKVCEDCWKYSQGELEIDLDAA